MHQFDPPNVKEGIVKEPAPASDRSQSLTSFPDAIINTTRQGQRDIGHKEPTASLLPKWRQFLPNVKPPSRSFLFQQPIEREMMMWRSFMV
jgi:hypothetical protein